MYSGDSKPLLVKICEFFVEDGSQIVPAVKYTPTEIDKVGFRKSPRRKCGRRPDVTPETGVTRTIHVDLKSCKRKLTTAANEADETINESLLAKIGRYVGNRIRSSSNRKRCCQKCNKPKITDRKTIPTCQSHSSSASPRKSYPGTHCERYHGKTFDAEEGISKCRKIAKPECENPGRRCEIADSHNAPDKCLRYEETLASVEKAEAAKQAELAERRLVEETIDTRPEDQRVLYPAYYYFLDDVKKLKSSGNSTLAFHSMELLARCLVEVWAEMTEEEKRPYFVRMNDAFYEDKRKWVLHVRNGNKDIT